MLPYPYDSLTIITESAEHWFTCCPFHSDSNPSFCINKKQLGDKPYQQFLYYKCFGCGEHGTAQTFAKKHLKHDNPVILETSPEYKEMKHKDINWETMRGCPLEHIPEEEKRLSDLVGVSIETIQKFRIGWRDYKFLIPMYDYSGICGIATRWYENGECKKRCVKYSKHGWFINQDRSFEPDSPIFFCEGWSDTATTVELGFNGIGRFNALMVSEGPFPLTTDNIYIISDNDEVGIKGSKKLRELIGGRIIYPEPGYKDIREMYLKFGKEQTKLWLEKRL